MSTGWRWPLWIAHRGGGNAAPENSLPGVVLAAACGFQAVEVDIRLAADGVPVVIHDDTLDRTTGHPGLVAASSSPVLERTPACVGFEATPHRHATVPALATLLRVVAQQGLQVNLELKSGPEPGGALVAAVAGVLTELAWALREGQVLLSAFEPELLAAARLALPALPRALLSEAGGRHVLSAALALECVALNLSSRHCTPDQVASATGAGLAVCAWTVNDLAQVRALTRLGVRSVFTDRLDYAGQAA